MIELNLILIEKNNGKTQRFLEERASTLPETLKQRINSARDAKTKNERIYSYVLLSFVLEKHGVKSEDALKTLVYEDNKKPFLSDSNIKISLSHTNNMAMVGLSDQNEIGVDIEKIYEEKSESVSKLITRFFDEYAKKEAKPIEKTAWYTYDNDTEISVEDISKKYNFLNDLKISLFFLNEDNILPFYDFRFATLNKQSEQYLKWTSLESELKCEGGGFLSLCKKKKGDICDIFVCSSVLSISDDSYAMALAVKKAESNA